MLPRLLHVFRTRDIEVGRSAGGIWCEWPWKGRELMMRWGGWDMG